MWQFNPDGIDLMEVTLRERSETKKGNGNIPTQISVGMRRFWAKPGPIPIENILTIQNDIAPANWTDVFNQGDIDASSFGAPV